MSDFLERFDPVKNLLIFAVFAAPMGAGALALPMRGFRLSLFRLAFWLALILFIIKFIKDKNRQILPRDGKTKYSAVFMVVWFAWAAVSGFWAKDINNYIRILFFLFVGASAVILFINTFKDPDDIGYAFRALNCGIFIQSVIGWQEIVTRNYHFANLSERLTKLYVDGPIRMPIAMCGNTNNFATLMFCGVFTALICAGSTCKILKKILYYLMSVNYAVLLLMTRSRANFLGLLLALVFLAAFAIKNKIILAVFIVAIVMLVPKGFAVVLEMLRSKGKKDSIYKRKNLILNGLIFLRRTYGFGVGNGQIEVWMAQKAVYPTLGIVNMHNWWMECLTAYGIIIFIGYLIFYINLFLTFFKDMWMKRQRNDTGGTSLMLCAFMTGFLIACISASSNMTVEWLWIFWAICVAYQRVLSIKGRCPYTEGKTESTA